MAHHISAKKRIRQTASRKLYNRYYAKTARNAVRNFRTLTEKTEAQENLPKLISSIDKLVKRGIIHKNKAANLKSKLVKKVNAM
jgi:small subunit ribosomal protein S20